MRINWLYYILEECRIQNKWEALSNPVTDLPSTPPSPKPCSPSLRTIASHISALKTSTSSSMQLSFLLEAKYSQQKSTLLRLWQQNWYCPVNISLFRKRNSPSPDRYTIGSDFEGSPKKGLTIGFSREDCKSISIFNQNDNPGPGNYNIHRENVKDMTMSSKFKFPSLWANSIAPGPGTCKMSTI